MKKILKSFLLIASLLLLNRCAVVVNPTGGPRDTTPPKLVSSEPKNYSTNFSEHNITILFDEFIKLNNVDEQLIVTPTFKQKPIVKIKGKGIVVDFKDTLQSNTTYTFNFGDAIQDITEGNKANGFKYVFSTGPYLDSAIIRGNAYDAYTRKPIEKAWVTLYKQDIDSLPLTVMPDYMAKTNKEGHFKIENLRKGKYKLVALVDKNNSFTFDQSNEPFAFADSLVEASDSVRKNFSLSMFTSIPKKEILLKKSATQYGKVVCIFNKPMAHLEINDLSKNAKEPNWFQSEMTANKDTLTIWIKPTVTDSINLQLRNNGKVVDTVNIALIPKNPAKNSGQRNTTPAKFGATALFNSSNFDLNTPLSLIFAAPLKNVDETKISLLKGKEKEKGLSYFQDSTSRKINFKNTWLENTEYTLICLPGAFQDILDFTNDTLTYKIKTRELQYYAQLTLNISSDSTYKDNYIIQLLNEKETVIYNTIIKGTSKLTIPFLAPGKYRLKAIVDKNNNGKWDTGDYSKKQQPETVIYNKEDILLRSNWEIEVNWNIKN